MVNEVIEVVMGEASDLSTATEAQTDDQNRVVVDAPAMLDAIYHSFGFSSTSPLILLDNLPRNQPTPTFSSASRRRSAPAEVEDTI